MQHSVKFKSQAKDIQWHIPSKYSAEMSQKSNVVSYKQKEILKLYIILALKKIRYLLEFCYTMKMLIMKCVKFSIVFMNMFHQTVQLLK